MDESVEKTPETSARRRNYRPAILVVALILIAGVATFVIALSRRGSTNNTNNTAETTAQAETTKTAAAEKTEETKKTEEKTTEPTPEPAALKEEEVIEGKTPASQDGNANTEETLTGVVNYAASDGETVMIRVAIDQYLETGECVLDLTASYDSFSLTDQISPSAATSSCSFDISTGLLTGGKYDITITVKSDNKKGTIKGEVEV